MEQAAINTLVEAYEKEKEIYKELSNTVARIVDETAKRLDFKHFPITAPEKDPEKLREKIQRKAASGRVYSSLNEIEDLARARIIFYLEGDHKKFVREIYEIFGENNVRVESKEEENGYRAT